MAIKLGRCRSTHYCLLLVLLVLLIINFTESKLAKNSPPKTSKSVKMEREYCIIGAGPAGLQMGYFLKKAGRDYVIYERNDKAGSYFEKFPRHRQLISINKRYTGRLNKEFNFRHDWNSLICDNYELMFTNYTDEYYPPADLYVKYLNDYKEHYKLRVKYKRNIKYVTKVEKSKTKYPYTLHYENGQQRKCGVIFVATGTPEGNRLHPTQDEFVEYYDEMNVDHTNYTNQRILILGSGNSAYETVKNLTGVAAYIFIHGSRVRLAWHTHYVGDLRAVNNDHTDAYLLKSLDAFTGFGERSPINKNQETPFKWIVDSNGKRSITSHKTSFDRSRELERASYDRIIAAIGFHWDSSPFSNLRACDASGLYQMYGVLADIAIINRLIKHLFSTTWNDTMEYTYLEEMPISFLTALRRRAGHDIDFGRESVLVMTFEFGNNTYYSEDDFDIFRDDRATGATRFAHRSKFLHPIFRLYHSRIFGDDYRRREDDSHHSHLQSMLGYVFMVNTQNYTPEQCAMIALTLSWTDISIMPEPCKDYLSKKI